MQKHVIKHFFKKTIFSSSSLGDTVIIAISGISIKRRYILNYRIRISILSIRVHADQEHVRPTTHSNLTDLDSFWQRITIRGNKIHSGFKATAEEIVCLSRSHFISVPSVYSQNTSSKPSLSAIVDRAGGLKTTRHDETNYYVQRQRRFDRNECWLFLFFLFFFLFRSHRISFVRYFSLLSLNQKNILINICL